MNERKAKICITGNSTSSLTLRNSRPAWPSSARWRSPHDSVIEGYGQLSTSLAGRNLKDIPRRKVSYDSERIRLSI